MSSFTCNAQAGLSLRVEKKAQEPAGSICGDVRNCGYFLGMLVREPVGLQ